MSYTTTQLQNEFNDLPEKLQEYIMSEEVTDTGSMLGEWFEIKNKEAFGEILFAILVGTIDDVEFIRLVREKCGLDAEAADTLFGEVGARILDDAHALLDQALEDAGVRGQTVTPSQASNTSPQQPQLLKTPPAPQPPRPIGDVRKFVGIPNYGIERPASSYTSVLPRSQVEINKLKDTPTADSFIKKLDTLGNQSMATIERSTAAATASTTSAATPSASPITPTTKTVPPPDNLPVLQKNEPPIELAKLARPTNIPRQEVSMTPPTPPRGTQPSAAPIPTSPNPKPYPKGSDPYREQPLP